MAIAQIRITNPNKVFTPVFYKLWNAKQRFVINYGGTGSSKSFSAAQKEVLIACERKVNTLVIRKVNSTLKHSVIASVRKRISELKLTEYFTYNKTEQVIENKITGSQFIFKGLDDPEKMKSIEGINRIMIEEASELDFEDFLELNRRVRGVQDIQITINFNPIHEEHWLKKHFFDRDIANCKIVKSTYKDNQFLTDEDRAQIEEMRLFNFNQYRIYALGEWGITENGNPWLHAFNADLHVSPVMFLPTYPIYLSFDFNTDPVTCLAWQMSPNAVNGDSNSFIHCIKEFAFPMQLEQLCERIKAEFPNSMFFVTGDRSGQNSNVGFAERHANYYTMIQKYLRLTPRQMNIGGKNMEHNDSRLLVNTVFHKHPNIKISATECPKLVNECYKATVDETKQKAGVLRKDRKEYKMDLFDGLRYFFQTYFEEYAKKVSLLQKAA